MAELRRSAIRDLPDRKAARARTYARLEELYRQAAAAGERHEMLRIIQTEILLLGLAAPQRVTLEASGPDGEPLRVAIVEGTLAVGNAEGGQR